MKVNKLPLTKTMVNQLRLARAKELSGSGNNIITSEDFKGTMKGLYTRGYIKTRKVFVNGRQIEGVYLTFDAVNLVNDYEKKC
jgi:hypothetical protein